MEEDLKKKLKINRIIICVLILVVIVLLIVWFLQKFNKGITIQNNLSNMGMVTYGDDYIFYYKQDKGIVKIKDGKEYQITDGVAYSLCYYNEHVYYMSPAENGIVRIMSVSQNGDENTILAEITTSMTKMYLEDGYLYFVTTNPNTISKIDLYGENRQIVITRTVSDFEVENGMIYFTDESGYLYQISVDSKNYASIGNKALSKKIQIFKNDIYYYSEENKSLMKMSLTGDKEEIVTDKLDCDIFNITDKGIFYLNKSTSTICSVGFDGKKSKEIVKINTENTKINICDKILYYLDKPENSNSYKTCRIKTNGKPTEEIK